ncbi:DUF4870 domain-containing protein [Halonotius sp. F2-221B]|uniref:DUF4870 domain-containing protein n=1 Tax=Halonotius sp. F2-221B TaxID=2731620 RepID=UPI00398A5965
MLHRPNYQLLDRHRCFTVFAKNHAKLNFQIVLFIATVIAAILVFAFIGILLLPILGIIDLIFVLIGTVKASNGEIYTYPLTPDII